MKGCRVTIRVGDAIPTNWEADLSAVGEVGWGVREARGQLTLPGHSRENAPAFFVLFSYFSFFVGKLSYPPV
jgi:hypothetical protein